MPREANRNASKRARNLEAGPWTRWRGSRWSKVARFIERYCRTPRGVTAGKLLKLAPWQKDWLEEIFAEGVSSAVMSLPRGQGKSTFAAALATWATFDEDSSVGSPVVPIIATTVNQATRSVYGQVVSMVNHEDELSDRAIIYSAIGNTRILVPRTEAEIFPISSDVDGLQGLDPTLALADEIGFLPIESWDALLLASGKRPRSLVLGLGTPGIDRDNALHHLRTLVLEGAELPGFRYREYSAPAGSDIHDEEVWRAANPAIDAGYLSIDALRMAEKLSPESAFRVFRLGQHDVQGIDCWLGEDGAIVWRGLEDPFDFVPGAPTWVGVDVGLKRDSTAIVSVQYREDGRLHAKAKVWMPGPGQTIDLTDIMGHLERLCETYKVGAISYDPRLFELPAQILHDKGLPMVEISQSPARMTPIVGDLYHLIQDGGLSHDRDEVFETHVLNAVPRLNDSGWTLQKSKSRGHIDACIALALAVDRAQHKQPERPAIVVL